MRTLYKAWYMIALIGMVFCVIGGVSAISRKDGLFLIALWAIGWAFFWQIRAIVCDLNKMDKG